MADGRYRYREQKRAARGKAHSEPQKGSSSVPTTTHTHYATSSSIVYSTLLHTLPYLTLHYLMLPYLMLPFDAESHQS
jgi:hypothetical protein